MNGCVYVYCFQLSLCEIVQGLLSAPLIKDYEVPLISFDFESKQIHFLETAKRIIILYLKNKTQQLCQCYGVSLQLATNIASEYFSIDDVWNL